jgi:hypothetical protein
VVCVLVDRQKTSAGSARKRSSINIQNWQDNQFC